MFPDRRLLLSLNLLTAWCTTIKAHIWKSELQAPNIKRQLRSRYFLAPSSSCLEKTYVSTLPGLALCRVDLQGAAHAAPGTPWSDRKKSLRPATTVSETPRPKSSL